MSERGKKFGRFIALMCSVVGLTLLVILYVSIQYGERELVTSISRILNTAGVVVLLMIGMSLMLIPFAIVGLILWLGARFYETRQHYKPSRSRDQPNVVVVQSPPSGLPQYPHQQYTPHQQLPWDPQQPRRFDIIGDNGNRNGQTH